VDLSIKYGVIIVSLYIDGSLKDVLVDGHKLVDAIYDGHKAVIENELGPLAIDGVEKRHVGKIRRSARIQLALRAVDIKDREKWPDYFKWVAERAEAIDKVLLPIVQEFPLYDFLIEEPEA